MIIEASGGWAFNPDNGRWYFHGQPSGSPPPDFNYGNPSYYSASPAPSYYEDPGFEPSPLPEFRGGTVAYGGYPEGGSNPAGYEPMPFNLWNEIYGAPPPMPEGMTELMPPPELFMPPDETPPPMPEGIGEIMPPPDVQMPPDEGPTAPIGINDLPLPPEVWMPPDESPPPAPEGIGEIPLPPDLFYPPDESPPSTVADGSLPPSPSDVPPPTDSGTLPGPPAVMMPPNQQPMPTWMRFAPPIVQGAYAAYRGGQRISEMARNYFANKQAAAGGSPTVATSTEPSGWFSPAYLESIGYREGQGTGSLWPGSGPYVGPYDVGAYGVGGDGGSFFHDLPGGRPSPLAGSFDGLGSFSAGNLSGHWGDTIGRQTLKHFLQTGVIPQDAFGHNLGSPAGWAFILQNGLANPSALYGNTSIGHVVGRGIPPTGEQ